MLDEKVITKAIIESYFKELIDYVSMDVAIAGSGPSGLTAAYYLAKAGYKVAVFEKRLSIGGGIWGGGMMFNKIVVQEEAKEILEEVGVECRKYIDNYFIADSVMTAASLAAAACRAGARIFNLITIEDVVLKDGRVQGIVTSWTSTLMAGLHVDPLTFFSRFLIDATGHDAEVVRILVKKDQVKLRTPTGDIMGERSMWAEVAEKKVAENTKEVFPGLVVAGMAANAVFGGPRMGPIFGGMLLSGRRAAELIIEKLRESNDEENLSSL